MRNLRQTTLSFAPVPKNGESSSRPSPSSSTISATLLQKPKKSKKTASTAGKSRTAMKDAQLPPPPRRSLRTRAAATADPSGASSSRATPAGQSRRASHKRKLSSVPDSEEERSRAVPLITVNPASSPWVSTSSSTRITRSTRASLSASKGLAPGSSTSDPFPPIKKPRLSSPLSALTPLPPSSDDDIEVDEYECVPTSQSVEQELCLPILPQRSTLQVQESVDKWRRDTVDSPHARSGTPALACSDLPPSPFSELSDFLMYTDDDPLPPSSAPETPIHDNPPVGLGLSYPQTPCSTSERIIQSHALATPPPISRKPSLADAPPPDALGPLTPPPSSDSNMEQEQGDQSPVKALDSNSKTEQIIAEIKARALAAVHSSPEQSPVDLDNLSDSSSTSSEEDDDPRWNLRGQLKGDKGDDLKRKGKAVATPGPSVSMRYNLRHSPSTAKPATPAMLFTQPLKKKVDPIGALLREKQRDERTGRGMVAIRAAEETLAEAKMSLREEMADEEDGSDSDIDWDALRGTARLTKSKAKTKSQVAGPSRTKSKTSSEDKGKYDVALINAKTFLGDKGGSAVEKILANDMKEEMARVLAEENAEPLGVALWTIQSENSNEDAMDANSDILPLAAQVDGNPTLLLLQDSVKQNNINRMTSLLPWVIVTLKPAEYLAIMPWLFDIAFSDVESSVATLVYNQMIRVAPLVGAASGLRWPSVLSAMLRLGASAEALQKHGYACPSVSPLRLATDSEWQDKMVYRLISVVEAYAAAFQPDDLSDILFAMVLIGMDPTTLDETQMWMKNACHALCQAMSPAQEAATCNKIVAFGRSLSPCNQAHLMSLIPSISPSSATIVRHIARCFLLDIPIINADRLEPLPDLTPYVNLLSPASGCGGPFDIPGNSDKQGYYDDLTHRVAILSRAMSDIEEYTLLERRAALAAPKETDSALDPEDIHEKEKDRFSVLEQIKRELEMLHGRIVDTRAAHLDRSRAKAALQRLSFRIHYQRAATLKSGVGMPRRPRNLLGYFNGSS